VGAFRLLRTLGSALPLITDCSISCLGFPYGASESSSAKGAFHTSPAQRAGHSDGGC